ncbi:RNA polymerase sigma factor [Flavitalea sp.]|nr:sigma-70 family RNA polymerase sigma factor [Flavitalea sp.]
MNHISENNESDRRLVKSVLSGDTQAFGKIIKNTEGLVAQIVFKLVENREDRRDLAQDVYLKVFANLSGFKFQSKLSTWIAQIAYNTCISQLQKKKLSLTDLFQGENEGIEYSDNHHPASADPEIETMVFQKQQAAILKIEIEKLPPLFKTLITLFHNEQLSYEEIGIITGLPTGTLRSYLFRARKMLKTNLLLRYKKEEL